MAFRSPRTRQSAIPQPMSVAAKFVILNIFVLFAFCRYYQITEQLEKNLQNKNN